MNRTLRNCALAAIFIAVTLCLTSITGLSQEEVFPGPDGQYQSETVSDEYDANPFTSLRTLRSPDKMLKIGGLIFGIAGGILFITGRIVRQPAQISVMELDLAGLTSVQSSEWMLGITENLGLMGFTHVLDFTVPELPKQQSMRLLSDARGDHTVLIVEIAGKGKQFLGYIEYQTILDNGGKINTNNSPMKPSLVPMPSLLISHNPRVHDPKDLFDIHLANVRQMQQERSGRIKPQKPEEFREDLCREWVETLDYQVEKGLMRKTADGLHYRGTLLLVLNALSPGLSSLSRVLHLLLMSAIGAGTIIFATSKMSQIVISLKIGDNPFLSSEIEALTIVLITLLVGYFAGMGGYLLGFLCLAPGLIAFEGGPIGYLLPLFLAATAGQLGEKFRNRPGKGGLPLMKHLSPEPFLLFFLLMLVGLV